MTEFGVSSPTVAGWVIGWVGLRGRRRVGAPKISEGTEESVDAKPANQRRPLSAPAEFFAVRCKCAQKSFSDSDFCMQAMPGLDMIHAWTTLYYWELAPTTYC